MRSGWLLACVLAVGCGEVVKKDLPDAPEAPPGLFKISGVLAGVAGSGVTLQLNGGDDLRLTADGAFSFTTELPAGASYEVTVSAAPTCPGRICTIENARGTIGDADVNDVVVTCREPKIRLGAHSSAAASLRLTDDLLSLANGATAVPRIVTGGNTEIGYSYNDSLAADPKRDLLYVATVSPRAGTNGVPQILVFENASTITGNVAPSRRIAVPDYVMGLELDVERDRLYLTFGRELAAIDNASTHDGPFDESTVIALEEPTVLSLDDAADRLYVGTYRGYMYIFDDASLLTSNSSPRSFVRLNSQPVSSLAIDACRNRLYIGFASDYQGFNIFAFDNASGLTGSPNLLIEAQAQLAVSERQAASLALDPVGRLYYWPDRPVRVHVINEPHSLAGQVDVVPNKTVNNVADGGHGMAVTPH